uniref:Uncharacterized protein n=1 Tax=Fagus sylvatica TaxID=28930 RepID=A0A2N9H0X5_FAGSY
MAAVSRCRWLRRPDADGSVVQIGYGCGVQIGYGCGVQIGDGCVNRRPNQVRERRDEGRIVREIFEG